MDGLAKEVHDLIAGLPPASAAIVAGMIVNEGFHYDLGDVDISKAYLDSRLDQLEDIKKSILRGYLSKRQAGESVDSLVAFADVIAKAGGFGIQGQKGQEKFDPKKHPRGYHGWFADTPGTAFHQGEGAKRKRRPAVDTVAAISTAGERARVRSHITPDSRERRMDESFVPSVQNYRRVQAGADFLNATVGGYLHPAAQVGLQGASFVGRFGSEAQAAFGPAMDRTKYRYKGVERKIDPDIKARLKADVGTPGNYRQRRERLVYGKEETNQDGKVIAWTPSNTIRYFEDHLPNAKLAALQRFSGHQPPSEGIIIDHTGGVPTQMVGHGDDWYLPFNLHNLGSLKGGEYIRTRTNGGLSTEDVYTGLMAGARSMTVVSHNGVYTMEFDDTLRGSRRYSQSARMMTDRYGQLLDAVKSKQVFYEDIDPSRKEELRAEASDENGNVDQPMYQRKLTAEHENPKPSAEMVRNWRWEMLDQVAERKGFVGGRLRANGPSVSPLTEMIEKEVVPKHAAAIAERENTALGATVFSASDESIENQARNEILGNPAIVADYANVSRPMNNYVANKAEDYVRSQQPIDLDGPGYKFAMDALKEQFPYYISRSEWHPFNENKFGRGVDRGYVKARYNRSDDLSEGYYDEGILGFGKVPASRTRYQNARITSTVETGYRGPGSSNIPRISRYQSQVGEGESGGNGGGDQGAQKSPDKPTNRRQDDMAFIEHVLRQDNFSQYWKIPGTTEDTMKKMRQEKAQAHMVPGQWMAQDQMHGYNVLATPIADLPKLSDDELHKLAQQLIKLQERDHVFDLDKGIFARAKNEGGRIKAKDIDFEDVDPELDEDIDFGDRQFDEGRAAVEYSRSWGSHPGVSRAVREGKFGEIKDPQVPQRVADYIAEKQFDHETALREKRGGDADRYLQDIMHALMAKQLHRLYMKQRGGPGPVGGGGIAPQHILPGGGQQAQSQQATSALPSGGKLVPFMSEAVIPRYGMTNN